MASGAKRKRRRVGPAPMDLLKFFRDLEVDDKTGCWLWRGLKDRNRVPNYVDSRGRFLKAHRWSYYTLGRGRGRPRPAKGDVYQTCGVRACVNPDHLSFRRD